MAEERVVKVRIDDAQIQKSLDNAEKKAVSLKNKLANLEPGTKHWKEVNAELEKVNTKVSQYQSQLAGKLSPSIQQLKTEASRLTRELNQMPEELRKASQEAKHLDLIRAKLREIRHESDRVNDSIGKADRVGQFANWLNKYQTLLVGFIGTVTGVVFGFKKLIDMANEFEDRVANLSSLTGLVGSELEYLKEQATELSQSTVEGNIRITKSAQDIVDAYTIVGSQRPELLKNKEALNEVTTQALILSEASKNDLNSSVKAVTTTLNQFNLEGREAKGIVNALAAGSKEGAGDVGYLTEAMEKSSTAAKFAKLSYEENIGLIETLAPRFASAEQAGTQLKNVLLKLETGPAKFRPSVVGLNQALVNLGDANLGATKMLKMFGQENINAASVLIQYRDEVEMYTKAVTGTSVALEQAATNTDTQKAKLAQARNEFANSARTLGEKLAPALTFSTNLFNYLIKVLMALPAFWRENRQEIGWFGIALIGLRLNAIITMIQSMITWIQAATVSFRAFTAAVASNPFGLAIAVISTLIGTIGLLSKKTKEATVEKEKLFDASRREKELMEDEMYTLKGLLTSLEKTTAGSKERQKVIDEINSKYGTTIKNLKDEAAFALQVAEAYEKIVAQLKMKVRSEALEEEAKDIENRMKAIKGHFRDMGVEVEKTQDMINSIGIDDKGNIVKGTDIETFELPTKNKEGINVFYTDDELEKVEQLNKLLSEQDRVLKSLADIKIKQPTADGSKSGVTITDEPDEKKVRKAAAFFEKVQKMVEDSRTNLLTASQNEVQDIINKYERLEKEALKYYNRDHDVFKQLQEAKANELEAAGRKQAEIEQKKREKELEEEKAKLEKLAKELDAEGERNTAREASARLTRLQKLLQDENTSYAQRKVLQAQIHEQELAGLEISEEKRKELKTLGITEEQYFAAQRLLINENYYAALEGLDKQYWDNVKARAQEYVGYFDSFQKSVTSISGIEQQIQLNQSEERFNRELEALNRNKERGILSEEQYQREKEQLEKKRAERERPVKQQQAIKQKEVAEFQAIMAAVVSILQTMSSVPFPFNVPLVAAQGAAAYAQVKEIQSRPVPVFGKGKDFRGIGNSHRNGGNPILDPLTGEKVAELEEGEVLLSKDTVKNNEALVNMLLDSSINRGGASINFAAAGRAALDFTPFFEAQRIMKLETGGKMGGGNAATTTVKTESTTVYQIPPELAEAIRDMNINTAELKTILKNGIVAMYDDDELLFLRRRLQQFDRIEQLGTITKS